MGTEVHFKSYSPVCYSMNNHNKNANSGSWPRCYEDKTVNAGNYYEPFLQMQTTDGYSESDKDELKQAMLKHEVIFRNQVHELHRLYGVQKDFMDKLKRNEVQKHQGQVEEFHSSRLPPEDLQNLWRHSQNHLNSTHHVSASSFMNCQPQQPASKTGSVKLDLQLSADEYLASEEVQQMGKNEATRVSIEDGYPLKKYCRIASKNDTNSRNPSRSSLKTDVELKCDLADLNEEFHFEEATTDVPVDVTNLSSFHTEKQEKNFISNPKSVFVGLSMEYLHNSRRGDDRMYLNIQHVENKDGCRGFDIHAHQSDSGPRSLPVSSWINPKRIPSLVSKDDKWPDDIDVKSTKGMDLNLSPSGGLEVGRTPHDFGLPKFGKIFGFPIVNKVLGSKDLSSEVPEAQYNAKLENLRTDLACRNHTISNSCMEEEEALVKARTPEMDLEVPAEPDALEAVATVEDSPRKELEKRSQSSESRTGTPQKPVTLETHDYEASVSDPLLWFAEVATSTTDDLESTRCVDDDELSSGMDYFESMTLKLKETKLDEYYPKSSVPDSPKEVTDGSSIMNKHCRGKGRRGGQQRNFQRDILPGFASLAKHEISEDLEMLKGLMRSMGHSWQIGEARKNAAKSGRGRGRRSPRGSNPLLASTYCV